MPAPHHPFTTTEDLALRAALDAGDLKALAAADALTALSGHRRQQVWDASALHRAPELLREAPTFEAALALPEAGEGEAIAHDYAATGLTLRRHPLALLRPNSRAGSCAPPPSCATCPTAPPRAPAASSPCASSPAPPRA
jgi:error-prone DNA polymerase